MKKKFPYNLDTKEKKEKFLNRFKLSFFIPLALFIISLLSIFAIPVSEDSNFNYVTGSLYLVGAISLQLFLLSFWIINLVVMIRSKQWHYLVASIPIPLIALIFYFNQFYPYLKGYHWSKIK